MHSTNTKLVAILILAMISMIALGSIVSEVSAIPIPGKSPGKGEQQKNCADNPKPKKCAFYTG